MEMNLRNKEQESSEMKKRMKFLENQIWELKMMNQPAKTETEVVKFDPFKMAFPGVNI